jgi:hypothetical protein
MNQFDFKMTDALRSVLKDELETCVEKAQEEAPLTEEPPLTKTTGYGAIRFLCDKQMSIAITGNNIDGDDRIVWDRRFLDQIKEARDKFYSLLDKGYLAYLIRGDGTRSKRRTLKFDPNAEEIIMVAPVTGG